MRLLDRYLMRELIVPFAYCLCGFFIFWITFDLFNGLGNFQRAHLNAAEVAYYYLIKSPEFLALVLPIALLLALLYALTTHARHNELTAIRAAGVSLARIAMPYVAVGFILSLALGAINELWVPQSNDAAAALLSRYATERAGTPQERKIWERRVGFTNLRDNRQWFIQAYNLITDEMMQPYVFYYRQGIRHEVSAERGVFQQGSWIFTNAQELIFTGAPDPTRTVTKIRVMKEFNETPDQIRSQIKVGKMDSLRSAAKAQLSIKEIIDYQQWHPEQSPRRRMLDTKLHGRIASPWTCLVVVLIALPFGASTGRGNVYVGVASSILICFCYYVLQQTALALGSGGYVPPVLAAWAPNLLFSATGLFLAWRAR